MARRPLPPAELERIREKMAELYGPPERITGADDVRDLIGRQGKRDLARRLAVERGISEKSVRDTLTRHEKGSGTADYGDPGQLDERREPAPAREDRGRHQAAVLNNTEHARSVHHLRGGDRAHGPSINQRQRQNLPAKAIEEENPGYLPRVHARL
jgi:hypothetical protein